MKTSWKLWGLGALIILLTVVAYIPALRGGFIWEDDGYVTQNDTLRTVSGLRDIWARPGSTPQYYPLVFTTFWVEHHLWGDNPFGYHLTNVLLHVLNALLLWRVLCRLRVAGAWWIAAIFALHPITVESIAWITERKNALSGTFYFLTMLAFLRFRKLDGDPTENAWDWRFYPVVILLLLCALLSKTVTCTLPVVLVLLIWWKKDRVAKWDVIALTPLFVLGAALGLLTAWLERYHVGVGGPEWDLSFLDRCLVAGRALWFYAGKLVWPHQLTFIYPRWEINARLWWQYLFPAAALVVLIILWRMRRRVGKGPLVAALFFVCTLAPALGFVDVFPFRYAFVADHFQYLASIGMIALAVAAARTIISRFGDNRVQAIGTLVGAAVLVVLGIFTWQQGHIYRDSETLWRDTVAKNPYSWMAHNNLGCVFAMQGKAEEAIPEYRATLLINPNLPETHHNLGVALAARGKISEAIAEYVASLQLNPNRAEAYHDLGDALAQQGRLTEAVSAYLDALQINSNRAQTHANLGSALVRLNRIPEAVQEYQLALQINPDLPATRHNLGVALASQGKMAEAIREYEAALRINPNLAETHHNLGFALASQGKIAEAIAEYERALRLKPDYPVACYDLAEALAAQGKAQEALVQYRQAWNQAPQWPLPLAKLAWILATHPSANVRNGPEAVRLAQLLCQMTSNVQPDAFAVLAAAYAEAGRFDEAVSAEEKAVELAHGMGQTQLAGEFEKRLKTYRAGLAYREASKPVNSP